MDFLFKDHETVESLDKVPEQYRGLYAEAEGGFTLMDNASVKSLTNAHDELWGNLSTTKGKLKTANDEAAQRRLTAKSVKEFAQSLGLEEVDEENPLNSVSGYVDSLKDQIKTGKEVKVDMDKIRQEADRRVQDAQSQAETRVNGMKGALQRHLVQDQARAAIVEAKGSPDLLLPIVQSRAKINHEGDDDNGVPIYSVVVVDESGNLRTNATGGNMGIGDFVAELKQSEKYARAFESEAPSGGGSRPGSGQRQVNPGTRARSERSSTEKIAAGLAARQRSGGR